MTAISIRELRNNGGEVVDRVARGEAMIVTRDGKPVAELRPLQRQTLSAETLLARWHHLPTVDPVAFRSDIDEVLDSRL